jgi:hypothetical protein
MKSDPLKKVAEGTHAHSLESHRQLLETPFPDKFESCKSKKMLGHILPGAPAALLEDNRRYSHRLMAQISAPYAARHSL